MLLADGYHDVPPGKVAAVVTYLEMHECPPRRAERDDAPWSLRRIARPALEWYRGIHRRVGTEWLWSSRLESSDEDLGAILGDARIEFHALVREGRDEGLLELDFREPGACELAFFGLAPELIGQGAGRWLMNRAIERAWARPIARLWLHTCTLDAPGALTFYRRSGFTPYALGVEVYDDPRVTGVLPRDAARQVPIIER
ncbi:MAG: GNAT family N-acetyltransferase [Gemmatimonadetes bacterium]|nr:GNAT family N-acetyltransferase [Gemmatimonadota bacterium]